MAFSNESLTQAAFKKLFGLAHTEVKDFPLGNEANASQITIVASDVYTESIPSTAQAIEGIIIDCTNENPSHSDSLLKVSQNLTLAPDSVGEGHPYLVTIPVGHGLIGQVNPYTGGRYAEGDIVNTIIPKKFGTTWRPKLYGNNNGPVEIPPLSGQDWIIDERGFIVIVDDTQDTGAATPTYTPTSLGCYVYVGETLKDHVDYVIVRKAYCAENAPEGSIIQCNLDTIGGTLINVVCQIAGQNLVYDPSAGNPSIIPDEDLNSAVPRLEEGDEIYVFNDGVNWNCTSLFQLSQDVLNLGDLTDVQISNPTNGQSLKYNGSIGKWTNQS